VPETPIRRAGLVPAVLFVNTAGSFFVLLRLSTEVSAATGSGLLAALVLTAPWLPALVLVRPLNRLLTEHRPAGLIRAAEIGGFLLTASLAVLPLHGRALLLVAAPLLMIRGFTEAVTRSSTAVLLKLVVPAARLNRRNTVAEIAKLAGTSTGAVLTGLADPALSLRTVVVLNAAGLGVSALLAWGLPGSTPAPAAPTTAAERPALWPADPRLRRLFLLFLLVAFWQGFHTIAVNVLPRDVLGGGTELVAVFVTVSAVAVFAGSFVALSVQRWQERIPPVVWALVPLPFLLTAVVTARELPTLVAYAIFLVLFEVAFVAYNNLILSTASAREVATVATLRATLLPLGVVTSTFGVGLVSDLFGPLIATIAVVAVTVVVSLATLVPARQWVDTPVRS
jgi:hypothetical protein